MPCKAMALKLSLLRWSIRISVGLAQMLRDPDSEDYDDSSIGLGSSRSSNLPQECIKHDFCSLACRTVISCILVVKLALMFYS